MAFRSLLRIDDKKKFFHRLQKRCRLLSELLLLLLLLLFDVDVDVAVIVAVVLC